MDGRRETLVKARTDPRLIPDSEDQLECGQGPIDQELDNDAGQFFPKVAEEVDDCLLVSRVAFPWLKAPQRVKILEVRGVKSVNRFGRKGDRVQRRLRREARRQRKALEAAAKEAEGKQTDGGRHHVRAADFKEQIRGKKEATPVLENVSKRRKLDIAPGSALQAGVALGSTSGLAPLASADRQHRPAFGKERLSKDAAEGNAAARWSLDEGLPTPIEECTQNSQGEQEPRGEARQALGTEPSETQQPEQMAEVGNSMALLGAAMNAADSGLEGLARKHSSWEAKRGDLKDRPERLDCAGVQQVHALRREALGAEMPAEGTSRAYAPQTAAKRAALMEGRAESPEKEFAAQVGEVSKGREAQCNQRKEVQEDEGLEDTVPLITESVRRATAGLEVANDRHERRRVAAEAAERRAEAARQNMRNLGGAGVTGAQGLAAVEEGGFGMEASSDEDVPVGRKRSKILRDKIRKRSLLGAFELAQGQEELLPSDAGLPPGSPGLVAPVSGALEGALAASPLLAQGGGQASVLDKADKKAGRLTNDGSLGRVAFGLTEECSGQKGGPRLANEGQFPRKQRLGEKHESQLQETSKERPEEAGAIELSGREAFALQSLRARGLLDMDSTVRTRERTQQHNADLLLEAGAKVGTAHVAKHVLGAGRESKGLKGAGTCWDGCCLGVVGGMDGALETSERDFEFDFQNDVRRKRRRDEERGLPLELENDLTFEQLDAGKEVGKRALKQLQVDDRLGPPQAEMLVLPTKSKSKSESLFGSQIEGDFGYEVVGFVSKIGGWALYLVAGACATRGETKLSDVRPVCRHSRRQFLEARAAIDYQAKSVSGLELTQLTDPRLRKQAWKASGGGKVYVVRRLAGKKMSDSEQSALGRACELLGDSEGGWESQETKAPAGRGSTETEERCPPHEMEVLYEVPQDKCRPCFQRFPKGGLLQAVAFAVRVEKWLHDPRCSICQDDIESVGVLCQTEQCGHVFHRACLLNWLESSNSCPTCRTRIPTFEGAPIAHKDLRASFDDDLPGVNEFADVMCEVCSLDESVEEAGNFILICDNCNKGYHLWCIALSAVPDGDWYCAPCQAMFLAACAQLEQPRLAPQNPQRRNRRAAQQRAPPAARLSPRLANGGAQVFVPPVLQEVSSEREDGRHAPSPDLGDDGLSPTRCSPRLARRRFARVVSANRSPLSGGGLLEGRRQRRLANERGGLRGSDSELNHELLRQQNRAAALDGGQAAGAAGLGDFFERGEPSMNERRPADELPSDFPEPQRRRRTIGLPVYGPQPPKPCARCKKNKKGGMHCLRKHGEQGGPAG